MDTLREENLSQDESEELFEVGEPVVPALCPDLPPEPPLAPEEDLTQVMSFEPPLAGAMISTCGKYRYELWRKFKASGKSLLWIMLNPSTADAESDDPTIRRVISFSKREGAAKIVVCNLFAYRATDPSVIKKLARDPVTDIYGWDNSSCIEQDFMVHETCIVAWGNGGSINRSGRHLMAALENLNHIRTDGRTTKIMCLGTTKAGHPRHPLYVSGSAALTPFSYRCKIEDDGQEDL